jgi:phosphoserine phosphatase
MTPQEIQPGLIIRGFDAPLKLSQFKVAAFDMDSTLINIECIDEIADAAGRKTEVAAITEAAMRGEITDFKDALRRRVALLQGVRVEFLDEVIRERLRLHPGAPELLAALHAAGITTLLVSGGFTYFAQHVQRELKMHRMKSNLLGIEHGSLTGQVLPQAWGDICDGAEKERTLRALCSELGCTPRQALAVGDGANDLPMMNACRDAGGLSVAYHAKPKVREQAMVSIESGGLDRLLTVLR